MLKTTSHPDLPATDPELLAILQTGDADITLHRKHLRRTVEADWVQTVEDSLPYLEAAIREPMHTLIEREEVRPTERSRHISPRADLYLARHTEHLRLNARGEVKPAKLLNVRREESLQVYENRFLNTLIRRLYAFVDRRYRLLSADADHEQSTVLRARVTLPNGTRRERMTLEIELSEDVPRSDAPSWLDRVERLHRAAASYCHSDFAKQMGDQTVHPPILPTNAIMQNKNLQKCLDLFRFLEQYDGLGCRVDVEKSTEHPDEACLREIYPLLAQQLAVFRRHAENTASSMPSAHRQTAPRLFLQTEEQPVSAFDAHDTEYRRVFPSPVPDDPYRHLSADERRICQALETALEADAILRRARTNDTERSPDPAERVAVNLDTLCEHFPNGARITPASLMEKQLIHRNARFVKILSRGEIRKALHITADAFSADARRCIEQAGGTATVRRRKS